MDKMTSSQGRVQGHSFLVMDGEGRKISRRANTTSDHFRAKICIKYMFLNDGPAHASYQV
jgi:hypothetical protein